MRLTGAFILLLFVTRLNAQTLRGIVVDGNTKMPVAYATILSDNKTAVTTLTGSFSLPNVGIGDTVTVTFIGYKTYKLNVVSPAIPVTIYLQPDNILLNQVVVRSTKNLKADSLLNRKWFASTFAYKQPGLKDIFITRSPYTKSDRPNNTSELISINALQLISLLFKSNNPTSRLQKTLLKDEEENKVDVLFTKGRVVAITGLKGDSLNDFMVQYRPTINETKQMTAYDMGGYIKKSYMKFINADTAVAKSR